MDPYVDQWDSGSRGILSNGISFGIVVFGNIVELRFGLPGVGDLRVFARLLGRVRGSQLGGGNGDEREVWL